MASEVGEIKSDFADATENFSAVVAESKQKIPKDKMNFFLSQIETINEKLISLEKTVEVGMPLAEAENSVSRLSNLERKVGELSSKMNLMITNVKDFGKDVEAIEEELKSGVSKKTIDALNSRLDYLEGVLKQYSGSKTKSILEDLVEIVQNFEKKINNIENFIEKDLQMYIDIEKSTEDGMPVPKPGGPQAETQEELEQKQMGFWDRIKSIFGFK